ncbi:hypothetical protein ABZP36_026924 [Zizania latifolia]
MAMMGAAKALVVVAMALAVLGTALGADYTVGAPGGSWDIQTNYAQWVSNINFRVGDQIVFKYTRGRHDVVEVSKADYDSCSSSTPVATFNSGDDTVPLTAAVTRYFICGIPGHCDAGMKVAIKVVDAATPGGSNTAPPPMAPRPRSPPAAMGPNAMPPVAGGQPVPPSSSAIKSAGVGSSLVGLESYLDISIYNWLVNRSIDPMAMMGAAKALVVVAMASAMLGTALGADYTVGAPGGSWDIQTNYAQWVSNINFRVGDQIVFKYTRGRHDVVEVSKADYDSCSSSTPVATFNSGDDTVPLTAAVTRYFICGIPGHCDAGMKVAIKVVDAATPGGSNTAPPPMAPRPRSPPAAMGPNAMPPVAGGQPVPPSSSAIKSAGVGSSLVGLGLGAIVAGLMVF